MIARNDIARNDIDLNMNLVFKCRHCGNTMDKIFASVYWCSRCGTLRTGRKGIVSVYVPSFYDIELPAERLELLESMDE